MFKKLTFAAIAAVCCSLVAEAAEPITYLDWDPETRQLEERTVTEYTVIDENWTPTELNGWYVVDGEEVIKDSLSVNGEAHIILKDGSGLYLHTAGLHVGASGSTTNAVTIYGQQEGTGVLSAWGASGCAAIGGQSNEDCGRVTINGGRVIAERGSSASGIGGGREGDGGTVTINGGTLDVPQSSSYSLGAGIGGGRNGGAGGVVTINGGCVSVYGGSKAAGIGGGSSGGAGATVTVNGGRVMAYGGANAAGIGGGEGGVGGAFVMNGGWVRSNGAGTAGIGSGASVTGLHGDFMVLSSDIAVAVGAAGDRVMTNTTATAYAVSRDRQVCLWHRKFTGPVAYMDWDESSMTLVERTVESCMVVDADTPFIRLEGWCVVEGVVSNTSLAAGTDARLILKDDALLVLDATNGTFAPGFLVDEDESKVNSLRIYGQSAGTGCLCAYGGEYGAGIGGAWSSLVGGKTCGNVSIYGGTINAQVQAYGYGAGIGGASGGDGGTVTIFGGQVTATSFNAGIGGGKGGAGGVVTINGGKVVAGGGSYSAGIGGGEGGAGGVVTINGGKVVAGGGSCSAGIGGGEGGDGGTVTINAGEVTATSGGDGAGIGGGSGGDGGDVTINGGKVTVVSDTGAGIGGGCGGSGGTATIAGGTVTAKSAWAAGIGAGYNQTEHGSLLAWDGFTVASSSGDAPLAVTTLDEYRESRLGNVSFWKMNAVSDVPYWAWDESAGDLVERTAASCVVIDGDWIQTALTGWYVVDGDVALSNLVVSGEAHLILKDGAKLSVGSAKASEPAIKVVRKDEVVNSLAVYGQEAGTGRLDAMTSLYNCVGIGGDWQEECGRVTIHGGIVAATGTEYGAGIGSSYRMKGGEVTINGGTVTAQGGRLGAGIGGGYQGGGGTLVVNGGVVTATGGENATGIGGGCEGGGGTLEVNGGVVTATGGAVSAGIGGGRDCAGGQVTINGGAVRATGGNGGAGIGGGMYGAGGPVAINGGTVTATGGLKAPGIGCGAYGGNNGTLTIAETLMVIAGATETTAVEMSADDYIYGRHGYVNVASKVIPQQTIATGAYASLDLVKALGIEIPDVDYVKGDKVTVKVEGLAKGLKVVATQQKETTGKKAVTNVVYTIEGVPTEAIDFETRPMYARVTTTYKDKTKGDKGKVETLQPIVLSVVPQAVTDLDPLALGESVTTNACEWLPGVTNGWSVSGLPDGLKYTSKAIYSGTGKKKALKYPAYTVYGKTTKAGLFTITAKKKVSSYYETLKYRVLVEPKAVDATVFPSLTDRSSVVAVAEEVWDLLATVGKMSSVSGLPSGLKFDSKKQTIKGTPSMAGTFVTTFKKKVGSKTKSAQILWTVTANPVVPEADFNVSGGIVLNRNAGSSYAADGAAMTFSVTPGSSVSASGLPKGLSLKKVSDGTWAIVGTPSKTGTSYVTVTVKLNGNTVRQSVAIQVSAHPLAGKYSGYVTLSGRYLGSAKLTVSSVGKVSLSLVENGVKTSATLSKVTAVEESPDDPAAGKWKCAFTLKAYKKGGREVLPKRTLTLVFERKSGEWELPTCSPESYRTSAGELFAYVYPCRELSKAEIAARVAAGRIPELPSVETLAIPAGISGSSQGEAVAAGEVVTVSAVYKASTATYTVTGRLPDGKTFSASAPVLWCGFDEPSHDAIGLDYILVANGAGDKYELFIALPYYGDFSPEARVKFCYYKQLWGNGQYWEADEFRGLFGDGDPWTKLPGTVSAALGTIPEKGLRFEFFWRAAELPGEYVHEERRFKVTEKQVTEKKKKVTKYHASVSADGGETWVTSKDPISWSAGRASFNVVLDGFTLTFDLALDKNGNLVGWARKSHTETDKKGKKRTVVGAAVVSDMPS